MTREQVRYIMGSPMVADVFHENRWDYLYLYQPGYGETEEKRVTVFFEDDRLARIDGSVRPGDPIPESEANTRQSGLVVPPQERIEPGILNKMWYYLTFRKPEKVETVENR